MRAWLKIVRQTTGETHPLLLLLPQLFVVLCCVVQQRRRLSSKTTFTLKPCECLRHTEQMWKEAAEFDHRYTRGLLLIEHKSGRV